MVTPRQERITEWLAVWRSGDAPAGERALAVMYDDLRRIARGVMRSESRDHTLEPTALVHEAYLRLAPEQLPPIADRGHLLAIASRLMRQVLVNHAERRRTLKRGGSAKRVPLDAPLEAFESRCRDVCALDTALARLERCEPRLARVVELRFFGGLTIPEAARLLDTTPRMVERDWALARAFLRVEIDRDAR